MLRRFISFHISVFLIAGFTLAVTSGQAHAYIDLGSGSLLLQTLLASFFASLFTIKVFWHRLTGYLSRLLSKIKNPNISE